MKRIILNVFLAAILCSIFNTGFSDTGKSYVIDNFQSAQQYGSEVLSQGRTWYSFGGMAISVKKNKLIAAIENSETWSGFGIDPGVNGSNGAPISTNGFKNILVDIQGSAASSKLELYENASTKYEIWIDLANISQGGYEFELPAGLVGKRISKMQFTFSPGKVQIELNSISLK